MQVGLGGLGDVVVHVFREETHFYNLKSYGPKHHGQPG